MNDRDGDEAAHPSFRFPDPPPLSGAAAAVVPELEQWLVRVAGQVTDEQPNISFWAGVFTERLHTAAAKHRGGG